LSNNIGERNPVANVAAMIVFSSVVEEGSFTAAARRLGLSKASVSREISGLEERLGAQLLRRTTRTMSLTEVGEIFFAHCQRVGEEAEAAELSIRRLEAAPSGVIRLAAPMTFGHMVVAPRLERFLARYPAVRVEFELTDRSVDLVHERIDLSIRIGRPRTPSYVLREVCPMRGLIVATPDYLANAAPIEHPEDLVHHNCMGYRGPTETWAFRNGRRIETRGTFYADNGDALRNAALAHLGLVYLPTFITADDIRAGRLVPVLPEETTRTSAVYTVYPESRHLSPKVRAMIDWLVEEFGGEPAWDVGLPTARRPAESRNPGR